MDVGFSYLAANQRPNFRTLSDFRKEQLEALDRLFVSVLGLCREAGLVQLGQVALDGRRLPGNAALRAQSNEGTASGHGEADPSCSNLALRSQYFLHDNRLTESWQRGVDRTAQCPVQRIGSFRRPIPVRDAR